MKDQQTLGKTRGKAIGIVPQTILQSHLISPTLSPTVGRALSPLWRGSLYMLAYWGITGIYEPYLNVYFLQIGLSRFQIGLLNTFFPVATLLVAPAISALADRRRWRRPLLVAILIGFGGLLTLLGVPRSFAFFALLIAGLAAFRGAITPLGDSLLARMGSRHGLHYGDMRLWGSVSFALVSVLAGALWVRVGENAMFILAGLLFVAVAPVALLLEEGGNAAEQVVHVPLRTILHNRPLVILLLTTFLMGSASGILFVYEGIYMTDLGGSAWLVGLLVGITALLEVPAMRYTGALQRWLGGPRALLVSYALLGLPALGYAAATTPTFLLLVGVLKGIGFGFFWAGTVQVVSELAPEEWSSTVQSLLQGVGWGLSLLLVTPLAGWAYDHWGAPTIFVASALLATLAMLLLTGALAAGFFARMKDEG